MAIRWIQDGEPHVAEVYNRPLRDFVAEVVEDRVPSTRTISVGNGLTGGGILNQNLTIDGINATKTTKGVTRFATREEAIAGDLQNVAIDPQALADAVAQNASTQPTITGNYTAVGTVDNKITMIGIVSALALEVGDVIQISGSTDGHNDKLYTVERIDNDNSIIVNYEHAGNRGNGSLRLIDQTTNVTIKLIAKWFNAPIGMGQAWVDVTSRRVNGTTYTNTAGRPIQLFITFDPVGYASHFLIDGVNVLSQSDTPYYHVACIVPSGSTYRMGTFGAAIYLRWVELI